MGLEDSKSMVMLQEFYDIGIKPLEDYLEKYPDNMIRIPMVNEERIRSLNLSNSVAIGVYEALRQIGSNGMR